MSSLLKLILLTLRKETRKLELATIVELLNLLKKGETPFCLSASQLRKLGKALHKYTVKKSQCHIRELSTSCNEHLTGGKSRIG